MVAETKEFLRIRADDFTRQEAIDRCTQLAREPGCSYVVTPNADFVFLASQNDELRVAIEESTISLPDGKGFTVAARIAGVRFRETVPGRWLVSQLMRRAAETGLAVYLFGSTEERLVRCARNLSSSHPDLQLAGWFAPPHIEELTLDFVRESALRIRRANADLLFLALGTPKQEVWMHRAQAYAPARLMIGVGGALDVLAGSRRNPPDWVNRTGLEWAFRLAQEPRRLWRRYLLHDPRIFVWALRDRLGSLSRHEAGSE